jgi:hypothetical protein
MVRISDTMLLSLSMSGCESLKSSGGGEAVGGRLREACLQISRKLKSVSLMRDQIRIWGRYILQVFPLTAIADCSFKFLVRE